MEYLLSLLEVIKTGYKHWGNPNKTTPKDIKEKLDKVFEKLISLEKKVVLHQKTQIQKEAVKTLTIEAQQALKEFTIALSDIKEKDPENEWISELENDATFTHNINKIENNRPAPKEKEELSVGVIKNMISFLSEDEESGYKEESVQEYEYSLPPAEPGDSIWRDYIGDPISSIKILITSGPSEGESFEFQCPRDITLGRGENADIVFNSTKISRKHLTLKVSHNNCKLLDLRSKNGSFVNGVRFGGKNFFDPRETELKNSDKIRLGNIECVITIQKNYNPFGPKAKIVGNGKLGYNKVEEISRGGMGIIYSAVEEKSGKKVVIKTLKPANLDKQNVLSFLREIVINEHLGQHPNIIKFLDWGLIHETPYLVLEFLDLDLSSFILREAPLALEKAAPIILGILKGLGFAHRAKIEVKLANGQTSVFKGVVHRDIKPDNILLKNEEREVYPKIADFGLSKSFEAAGLTNMSTPGQVAGTPMYWPIEQLSHYRYLPPASDVFSSAAVFYELLTGVKMREVRNHFTRSEKPTMSDYAKFVMENPAVPIRTVRPTIPKSIATILDRALREKKVPKDVQVMRKSLGELRYLDAEVFYNALKKAFIQESLMT